MPTCTETRLQSNAGDTAVMRHRWGRHIILLPFSTYQNQPCAALVCSKERGSIDCSRTRPRLVDRLFSFFHIRLIKCDSPSQVGIHEHTCGRKARHRLDRVPCDRRNVHSTTLWRHDVRRSRAPTPLVEPTRMRRDYHQFIFIFLQRSLVHLKKKKLKYRLT